MVTYKKWSELCGKTLAAGDKVFFPSKESGEQAYDVCEGHLNNPGHPNDEVFDALRLDKTVVAKNAYGYEGGSGQWPPVHQNDFAALTRLVLLLFAVNEKRITKECAVDSKLCRAGWTVKKGEVEQMQEFKPGMKVSKFIELTLVQLRVRIKRIKGDSGEELKELQSRIKQLETYTRCVLHPDVRRQVESAIIVVLRRSKFDEWGLTEQFEKGITNAILMHGPPGTGKTMMAESIASVLGRNLTTVSTGDLQSQIPGQMERNIKKAFEQAKGTDSCLLLDECDSLLVNRDHVGFIIGSEINALLTEIERFDGVVMLTTNRIHTLDPALQRRIVAKVEVLPPEREARAQIWANLIPKKMPTEGVDYGKLADAKLSGGEIKNAILLAARYAIAENKDAVEMHDFERAVFDVVKSKQDFEDAKPSTYA
jgi:SpoVK/Ycf46/Vps4 family AAA+-type ATPase